MKLLNVLLSTMLALSMQAPAFSQNAAQKSGSADYKVGERLKQGNAAGAAKTFKEISWEELVPKHWDPERLFKDLDFDKLEDNDPRAMQALELMRKEWNEAPVEPSMKGARIRIPGFVVPLDTERGQIREFLLVPYFGACIHTPPPPANQIIHVVADKPLKNVQIMDAVWVNGTMDMARTDTEFGTSGYQMKAEAVTPYKGK